MQDNEIPMEGGNTSEGVVRVGDTVRKKLTKSSSTTQKLLEHIRKNAFANCPEFLGIDNQGREMLSFIDGDTGIPDYIWSSDDCLKVTAKILRHYHDATIDFPHELSDVWAFTYPDEHRHEVIGHNDFAPYNTVYKNELPISVIDFDLAGPAPRSRDLAYAAYWNVPLSFNDNKMKHFASVDLSHGSKRLKMFCKAYGTIASEELLEMVSEVLAHMGDERKAMGMIGESAARQLREGGHFDHWRNEHSAFNQQKPKLLNCIS